MTTEIQPTRVAEFIEQMMPWAHGHQLKAISKFVLAIIDKQTGCQAELARTQGNQEAAAKRLSRLIHNPRLKPKDFARWLCLQVLANQVPRCGKVRLTIDWTTELKTIGPYFSYFCIFVENIWKPYTLAILTANEHLQDRFLIEVKSRDLSLPVPFADKARYLR